MILATIAEASRMPFAPTRAALYKQIKTAEEKQASRPRYFVDDRGKVKVDIDHPDWKHMLEERQGKERGAAASESGKKPGMSGEGQRQETSKRKPGRKASTTEGAENNQSDIPEQLLSGDKLDLLIARSKIALLEEQILKNDGVRYLNEQKKIKLKKEAGELIEFKLAEFLFLGHIEKLTVEILGLCKKIEPMLDNLVKKGDTKGVIELFNRHFENILTEVKKAQSDDLRDWEAETE